MNAAHCDVAVVGGGISGAATACALAAAGLDVQLIERGRAPAAFDPVRHDARVYALAPLAVALLEDLGVWPAIRSARAAPVERMRVWDRDAARALHFDAADSGAAQLSWIVEHGLLAHALWQMLPQARLRTGVEVAAVEFAEPQARLRLSDGSTLHAQLVIGAEGADSPLREAAGLQTQGWSYDATAVVCHLRASDAPAHTALQRFLPAGPIALLPLADGRCSLVWSTTAPDAQALMALDDDAFARELEDATQGAVGSIGALTPRLAFPLRLMHAQGYVAPRCALVGDSAHLIHPLAGQGLNLGLADAGELARQLIDTRTAGRDWSALRCLRRYERARQSANLEMLAMTDALSRAFALDLPGWRRLLHAGLRGVERLGPLKHLLAERAAGVR